MNKSNNLIKIGTSETIRVLSLKQKEWLAGVIDGDGNFDIRNINKKRVLKSIRVKLSVRDLRILLHIKDLLKCGTIRGAGKNLFIYQISNRAGMIKFLELINGNIRLKSLRFEEACLLLGIKFIPADFKIPKNSAYLSGLIDTDGSIVYNSLGNRIELNLELKWNEYSEKLDLSDVIEGYSPKVSKLIKRNQTRNKIFYSLRFSYNTVSGMPFVYNYIKNNRLYSDFKFYRGMKIKSFLEIRQFKNYSVDSYEYLTYKKFLKKWFLHLNEHKPLPKYLVD